MRDRLRWPRAAARILLLAAIFWAVVVMTLLLAARAAQACAVALLLAMDVSGSVSAAHVALQRDATAEALTSPPVLRAAEDGLRIGVIQWGTAQHLVVPFGRDPRAVAAALAGIGRAEAGWTDVAGAIRAGAAALLAEDCERRVLDLSGDGRHSASPPADLDAAVAEAVAAGIEINALPIVTAAEPDIAEWFRDHVTGPAGGFVIAATPEGFARAIRAKLALEIATAPDTRSD